MHHYGVVLLYVTTLFSFSEIIGPNIVALNPRREPAYKTVQFNPNWFNTESDPDEPTQQNEAVVTQRSPDFDQKRKNGVIASEAERQIFKTEEFILAKNIFRAESYAKAALGGSKDYRAKQKEGTLLGFKAEGPKNVDPLEPKGPKKIVCYYNVPTVYDRPYPVFPEQIDPTMCTHIMVAFARVSNLTLIPSDPNDLEFYPRIIKLKEKNPNLKVMLSVAASNRGAAGQDFAEMMVSQENRGKFIQQSVEFLKKYGFDGIDVDWEFPAVIGPMSQRGELIDLLQEFKEYQNKPEGFLISAAVPSPKEIVDIGYDIEGIAKSVDFINLMTYDFHYYSMLSPVTGPNSPLYNMSQEIGFFATLNLAWSAKYWYQNGMPANKIIVGIPLYGHAFTLVDERYNDYYAFAEGYGTTGQNGFASYVEICKYIEGGAQVVFNEETQEPYAYRVKEWVSFDNQRSVKEKAKFIKDMDFGGAMFYSLNSDDAWKICKSSKTTFPLITTVKKELES